MDTMNKRLLCVTAICGLLLPLLGQQSDRTGILSVNVTRVNMLFTVTDKKGRFVTDLPRTISRS